MKTICRKIHVSPFFLIIILTSLISGLFRDIIILFLVIIIHEIGHATTSLIYNWKIKRIDINICGGYITYEEVIDKPFKEEFFIAISGFVFQTLFFLITFFLCNLNIIDVETLMLVKKYHYSVLIFNMLPVFPLDGAKILGIFLSMFISYKRSLKIINIISFVTIILILLMFFIYNIKIEYSYIMILSFIVSKLIKLVKEVPYIFNKFLFERYVNPVKSRKYIYVNNNDLSKIRRQHKHYFLLNNHYYSESEVLSKRFD